MPVLTLARWAGVVASSLAVAGFLFAFLPAWWRLNRAGRRRWTELHHAYYGLALAWWLAPRLAATTLAAHHPAIVVPLAVLLAALGAWLVWDDALQHRREWGEPGYVGPIHRWAYAVALPALGFGTLDDLPRWMR